MLDAAMSLPRAVLNDDVHLVMNLLNHGCDPNEMDAQGRTALFIATSRGRTDFMELLLSVGADVNLGNHAGNTPLHVCGHLESLRHLYENGADIQAVNKAGYTPLALAQRRGVAVDVQHQLEQWSNMADPPTPMTAYSKPRGLWNEFFHELGPMNMLLLLLCLMVVSGCVAYSVTGYSHRNIDTRIPIEPGMTHIEL